MMNLILSLGGIYCSFLGFINSKREQEISFAPDTIHNEATLRIVHHGEQVAIQKPLIRLHSRMVLFAVWYIASVSAFEKESIIAP